MIIATDIKQSKKLAKILPIETADMFYADGERPAVWNNKDENLDNEDIPCWSLAALLDVLPEIEGIPLKIEKVKAEDGYKGYYYSIEYEDKILIPLGKNPVDVCYEMVIKLHNKITMSNKEEQSEAYIKPIILYSNKNLNDNNWKLGLDYLDFTGYEVQCAFESGYDAGKQENEHLVWQIATANYEKGKKEIIDKACEFIQTNVRKYHKSGVFHVAEFIKDLRKAMEE